MHISSFQIKKLDPYISAQSLTNVDMSCWSLVSCLWVPCISQGHLKTQFHPIHPSRLNSHIPFPSPIGEITNYPPRQIFDLINNKEFLNVSN